MSDGQSLAKTLTARMQLGMLGTSNTIAHGVRVSQQIAKILREGGAVRPLQRRDTEEVRISGITTLGRRVEAFAGYLYLVIAVRRDVTIRGGQVAYGTEDSVSEINVLPYGDVRQRMGLKQYGMSYRLLKRMFGEPDPPRLVLLDHTLLLPPEFANSEDEDVKRDYERLAEAMNVFWQERRAAIAPWTAGGTVIVGLPATKRLAEPLRSVARGNEDLLVDEIGRGVIRTLGEQRETLEDVGAARVMATVLWPDCRSMAFAYSAMDMDKRLEPKLLRHELDIASFHYRTGLRTPPLQAEMPGGKEWTSEALDGLASKLREATLFDQPDSMPLPLWLGRQQFKSLDTDAILTQYQQSTFGILRSGELDEGWLSGWEPEGDQHG